MNFFNYITTSINRKIIFGMFTLFIISGIIILYTITTKLSNDNIETTKNNLEMFSASIFNNLRNVMNTGDSATIKKTKEDLHNIEGVENLTIVKSKELIELYGAPYEIMTKDTLLLSVFKTKQNKLLEINTKDEHSLRMIKPMIATNECLQCHANQNNGDVIGIMDITFSLNEYDKNLNDTIWEIIWVSSLLAILNVSVILYIIRRATKPIDGLKHGFTRLLNSNESHNNIKLQARTQDEIGEVITLFNTYMDKLNEEITSDANQFATSVLNTQTSLIVTSKDRKKINSVNTSFLKFFNIKTVDEFFTKYGPCVCDAFEIDDSGVYIQKTIDGKDWREYIRFYNNKSHKVKMNGHIFDITLTEFTLNESTYYTSVFTDITELEQNSQEINESHKKIQKLLDSVNQGFLYFDRNMIIGSEYSKNAEDIFPDVTIDHQDITKLLYQDKEKQQFLKETLQYVFDEDENKQDIVLSLLEKNFIINNKNIEVEYKVLSSELCMVILTDMTDKIALNKQLEKEKQILKMIVEISTNTEQFLEVQDSYKVLTKNIHGYKSIELLPILRREVHTLKGLFAQKEMLHIVEHLHNFETIIDEALKTNSITEELQSINSQTLESWIEDDLAILKVILGQDFFSKLNFISIDKKRIDKLKEHIERIALEYDDNALESLTLEVEKFKLHNIKIFLQPYVKLVEQIAQKLNKSVYPLVLECDEIYIHDKYKNFLNSLVHIFRNSVDHGIEDDEIREERLKATYGRIKCKVIEVDNTITISISDDGNGIDLTKIKQVSLDKGIYTRDEIESLDEQEILRVIFADEFTTTEKLTTISGRGVGLSSVLNELNQLNGSLHINNKPLEGVEFTFTLPK